jgi:hypothetical protein
MDPTTLLSPADIQINGDNVQALGVAVDIGPEGVAQCLQEVGLGFMFAPRCCTQRFPEIKQYEGRAYPALECSENNTTCRGACDLAHTLNV